VVVEDMTKNLDQNIHPIGWMEILEFGRGTKSTKSYGLDFLEFYNYLLQNTLVQGVI
jgi:hypothetical protein